MENLVQRWLMWKMKQNVVLILWYLKEYFQIWKPRMLPLILINVPTPIEGSEVIIKKVET